MGFCGFLVGFCLLGFCGYHKKRFFRVASRVQGSGLRALFRRA